MAEVDFLLKLFDTLQDASKETHRVTQALLTNQNDIATYMKNFPLDELKDALKEHNKEAMDGMGVCTETINTTSDTILKHVKIIDSKISKMITVVIVAFVLFTSAVFIAKFSTTPPSDHLDLKATIIELKTTLEEETNRSNFHTKQQNKLIEDLRKSIKELQKK